MTEKKTPGWLVVETTIHGHEQDSTLHGPFADLKTADAALVRLQKEDDDDSTLWTLAREPGVHAGDNVLGWRRRAEEIELAVTGPFFVLTTWEARSSSEAGTPCAAVVGPYPTEDDAVADIDDGRIEELLLPGPDVTFDVLTLTRPPEAR